MFKKIFSLSLLFVPTMAYAQSFLDVPKNHPNSVAISYMKEKDIVSGYPDGTFRPDAFINRAEFVKLVIGSGWQKREIHECPKEAFLKELFDVDTSAWYAPYICQAMTRTAISGYPDHTFRPENTINFVEAAKIIESSVGNLWSVNHPEHDGKTVVDETWYRPFVKDLETDHAIPLSIKSFEQKLTRGELAEILWRIRENRKDSPSRTYNDIAEQNQNDLWPEFTNIPYGYTLNYPPDSPPTDGGFAPGPAETATSVHVGRVNILPRDPSYYSESSSKEMIRIMQLPLKEYAEAVYEMNDPSSSTLERTRGPLEKISIDGSAAYRFWVNGVLKTEDMGSLISERTFIVLFAHDGMNFRAMYDVSAGGAEKIMQSISFKKNH
jgi:hypothetical protein